ncbi:MAG: protein kinase [Myxococcales bacterium]|nr:protein kinase [Myxococcales bacterium]
MKKDVEILLKIPAFSSLSEEEANRLVEKANRRDFAPGAAILRKGEEGDAMYVIMEGAVLIPILDGDGAVRFTARLEAGNVFGEMALLTGERRSADVIVVGDEKCVCLEMKKQEVDILLRQHPPIARFLTEILSKRLLESEKMRQVGKYTLVSRLGRGGTAIVFNGQHLTLDRQVAVKMLDHSLSYNISFVKRFQAEAQLIANLSHENIVQVYDAEEAYGTYFIVMEKLKGQNLGENIQVKGKISFDDARDIIVQTASALQYAHEHNIIHRDIKPANIFLENNGRVKLMDFGIAQAPRVEKDADISDGFMGTPGYVAPEQIAGKSFDHRVDIYALGVVAFIMLTAKKPFPAPNSTKVLQMQLHTPSLDITRVVEHAPEDLAAFVRRATANDPEQRFPDCSSVLQHFAHHRSVRGLSEMNVQTLTLLYTPEESEVVQRIIEETRQKLTAKTHARVFVGHDSHK